MTVTDNPALQDILTRATLAQQGETARALKKPQSLKRVLRMAERALDRAEQTIAAVSEVLPPPAAIACQANCPYCCHIRLTASPPEILLVLNHIRENWDEEAILALRHKVKNTDAFTRGKSDEERAQMRLPCPLLKDGSCSIHSVRPLSCRAVVSVNVKACKQAYSSRMENGVPMHEPQHLAANAIGYGIYAGLVDSGYGVENIEIVAALADGLTNSDLGRKWLKKQISLPS
ncbi:MAG: YkgJ family cysteine cluster protein [Magnetovibrio sp.]|nr:YkgJ family cysteine cluster protein [Magnetovibrio sp.]